MAGRKATPSKVGLNIPTVPVQKFQAAKKGGPTSTLIVEDFNWQFIESRTILTGFADIPSAANAHLFASILSSVSNRLEWTRTTTAKAANASLRKIKRIEIGKRDIEVMSLKQFRIAHPEFDAIEDAPLVLLMQTMRPDLVIIS